jgi:hypothetical protein
MSSVRLLAGGALNDDDHVAQPATIPDSPPTKRGLARTLERVSAQRADCKGNASAECESERLDAGIKELDFKVSADIKANR